MAGTGMESPPSWEEAATDLQQKFFNLFGEYDWDSYEYSEREFLERKVGFALFGPPSELPSSVSASEWIVQQWVNEGKGNIHRKPSSTKDRNETGYTDKQYENIQKICSAIFREDKHGQGENSETFMSIIFVCLEVSEKESSNGGGISNVLPVPIFRVPNNLTGSSFIDSNARVYKNWNDFLKNNELPQCRYCFPHNGFYQTDINGFVLVDFENTPASKVKKKVLTALDITNAGVCLGIAAVSATSFFVPIAAPLMIASTVGGITAGAYGAVRNSSTLVDRAQHKQSIGLKDSDARNCWLSLAGSVFGTASMGATTAITRMTQAGQVISKAGRVTTTILSISSLTINGLGVLNGAFVLQNKCKRGELTPLDVFQFTASVLFFTHSAVTLKTADTIIKETQTDVIQKYQNNLEKSKLSKVIRKVTNNTSKHMDSMEGRAKVIRSLKQIENKDDFLSKLMRPDKFFRKTKSDVKFAETGNVEINGQLPVNPKMFSRVNRDQHQIIVNATENLAEGNTTWQQFTDAAVAMYRDQNVSTTQYQINERMSSIGDLMGSMDRIGISSGTQHVLQCILLYDMASMYNIMTNYDKKLYLRILEVASRLFEKVGNFTTNWFLRALDFVCKAVCNIASQIEERYQDDLRVAKWETGADFDQEQFDRYYDITGKRFDHFCSIILEKFISDPMVIESLKKGLFSLIRNLNYSFLNSREVEDNRICGSEFARSSQMDSFHLESDSNPIRENVTDEPLLYSKTQPLIKSRTREVEDNWICGNEFSKSSQMDSFHLESDSNPIRETVTDKPLLYSKTQPLIKSRTFCEGEHWYPLNEDEIFDIAQEVTGLLVDCSNCQLEYRNNDIIADISVQEIHALYVTISCNIERGMILAYAY